MRTVLTEIPRVLLVGLSLLLCGVAPPETVLEQITFDDDGTPRTISGRVVVKAVDGGLLVQERDGRLWTVTSEVLGKRVATTTPFRPEAPEELGKRLAAELDKSVAPGFHVTRTRHYTIVSSADPRFARWTGRLFERLRTAFVAYWKGRGVKLADPEFPLVAIVLKDRGQFSKFIRIDANLDPTTTTGYYSILSNRIVLYDIARIPGQPPAATAVEIQRRTNRIEDRGVLGLEIVGRTLPQSIRCTVQRCTGRPLGRQFVKRSALHSKKRQRITESVVPEREQIVATAARLPPNLHFHLRTKAKRVGKNHQRPRSLFRPRRYHARSHPRRRLHDARDVMTSTFWLSGNTSMIKTERELSTPSTGIISVT